MGISLPRSRWRRAALGFALTAVFTFAVNLGFVLWATTTKRSTIRNGVGTVAEQSCSSIKTLNTLVHLVINILSTILLAGSNYCMQCLIAPTRSEIDSAHKSKKWLDVGVPSIRNFSGIADKRRLLWILLSVSSLPLHLLYNSVVFTSTSANLYTAYIVNERFLTDTNRTDFPENMRTPRMNTMYEAYRDGKLEHVSLSDCVSDYGAPFQSARGNVLLVKTGDEFPAGEIEEKATMLISGGMKQNSDWICKDSEPDSTSDEKTPCDDMIPRFEAAPEEWTLHGNRFKECYSQKTEEHCKLLFSSGLCWTVTLLNLLKAVLMLFVAFGGGERPILTIGDAVASFLKEEDPSTKAMCLKSKRDFWKNDWLDMARQYDPRPRRKFAAATRARWLTCISLYVSIHAGPTTRRMLTASRYSVAVLACFILLCWGLGTIQGDKDIAKLGLGAVNGKTVIESRLVGEGYKFLVQNAMLANTPQVIMSLLYFTYNALYTSISLVTEWDRLAGGGDKGLRVSSTPRGEQRETYFLQLPYRYSLPLAAFSGGLHWLISQSIFLVNIEVWKPSTKDIMTMVAKSEEASLDATLTTCGWSPMGIVFVIVAGVAMVGFLLFSGARRLRFGGIPVAASCSAAISAACHPGTDEKDAWEKPLRWGVVAVPAVEPRHCSFSSEPVEVPVKGQLYA
ncbi:hypothetical protein CMUS01_11259 [Colletotrichum musicola]|uniref:DUF6536 domain-containing protein n=1 Tax=Colletotrichum musicola TaxID=2175873 RepID=A0A8H6N6H6_9PEZI|nr:hypothetical protein CMUS01_11259 [Colletotrichum musicola]